jgi:hypothetical protein
MASLAGRNGQLFAEIPIMLPDQQGTVVARRRARLM